jgi:hypothetical protein
VKSSAGKSRGAQHKNDAGSLIRFGQGFLSLSDSL